MGAIVAWRGFSAQMITMVKKSTKRETFLVEMKAVVTWRSLIELFWKRLGMIMLSLRLVGHDQLEE